MATVLERFKHLGLAHNNKILMIVGQYIAGRLDNRMCERIKVPQKEGEDTFMVWNYPDGLNKELDILIINFLEHYLQDDYDFIQNGGK